MRTRSLLASSVLLLGTASLALAAPASVPGPQPAPPIAPIPAPRDVAYPGTLSIHVDATDLARHIFRVEETVPVAGPGPMTLLYPQWIPGNHNPSGPIDKFAGLVIHADGKLVRWTRDPVHVYAFDVDVPDGAKTLELSFQYLSPVTRDEGRIVVTPAMLNLEWWDVALYPAGYFSRDIEAEASVKLPQGWHYATALTTTSTRNGVVQFAPVSFNTLVDSPLDAGRYYLRENLTPSGHTTPVHLDVFADSPDQLQITPAELRAHRSLVSQAYKLFDSHHYNHYDFLLSLSNQMGGQGLEHHRSSEDGTVPGYFINWNGTIAARDLLSHEYTHSWNGKFRRPFDLWTPNFNVPMRDSLLWMYEGQTQYWGFVLAARSGLWTHQEALDAFALTAATYDHHVGHAWRSVEDTTNDPVIAHRAPIPWRNYQLSEDYYSMGQLTWLDADTLIRKLTHGRKSLDDFARLFFGMDNGSYVTRTYTLADIVHTLNEVVPYDWAGFLKQHIYEPGKGAPLGGIVRGGYKLVYTAVESPFEKSTEHMDKFTDFSFSLGFTVDKKEQLTQVLWGSPAFDAGLTVGTKILALNGTKFTTKDLKRALDWGVTHSEPLTFIVEQNKSVRTVEITYHGGQRFPHLVPVGSGPHSLDAILAAR
ncbi:MAG: M61 family metallopeptidase [Alphaproteobacteria bacterium]|nr:M61 family metallopeptidase [Alphaproteobacteria bacterium]